MMVMRMNVHAAIDRGPCGLRQDCLCAYYHNISRCQPGPRDRDTCSVGQTCWATLSKSHSLSGWNSTVWHQFFPIELIAHSTLGPKKTAWLWWLSNSNLNTFSIMFDYVIIYIICCCFLSGRSAWSIRLGNWWRKKDWKLAGVQGQPGV